MKRTNAPQYRRYGLTTQNYADLVKRADGKCECCGDSLAYVRIDHDHQTGQVRGLICQNCNTGLGHFKESVKGLEKGIAYLKRQNDPNWAISHRVPAPVKRNPPVTRPRPVQAIWGDRLVKILNGWNWDPLTQFMLRKDLESQKSELPTMARPKRYLVPVSPLLDGRRKPAQLGQTG